MSIKFKTLYSLTKNKKLQTWKVWSAGDSVYTEFGLIDGKKQRGPGKKCLPTNEGRSNERNAEQQADFVARSMFKFRLDRGYSKVQEDAKESVNISPMLALVCKDIDALKYPVNTQPKLDGCRAICYRDEMGEIKFMPKSGVGEYKMPHIAKLMDKALPLGVQTDGEFYRHGLSCQQVISLVKKNRPESEEIQYHIYDAAVADKTFKRRWPIICEMFSEHKKLLKNKVIRVRTRTVEYPVMLKENFSWALQDGYEGMMIRLRDGLYEFGHRSKSLLKLKPTADAEFTVDRVRTGVGKMNGCAIFVCRTKDNKMFECMMACPQKERQEQWKNKESFYGKKLTVMYQDLTDDGIPRFPRGKCFREEKDLT